MVNVDRNPIDAATLLVWYRIWFADSLRPDEARRIFGDDWNPLGISDDELVIADSFERKLTSCESIPWKLRMEIFRRCFILEGRHSRENCFEDEHTLFGHQLGHFWGDFVNTETEVKIYKVLTKGNLEILDGSNLTYFRHLSNAMEVLECAMETDIQRAMINNIAGGDGNTFDVTYDIAYLIDEHGLEACSDARLNILNWYEKLAEDPEHLYGMFKHQLIGAASTNLTPVPKDNFLGDPSTRKKHTANLKATIDLGLEFMYGEARDDKVIVHKHPDEIREIIAEALPRSGLTFQNVLNQVRDDIAKYSIAQGDPRYFAFPDSGNAISALSGSILSPMFNQNLIAFDRSAPAATFVEIQVVEWLRELIGYEALPIKEMAGIRDMAGLWTSGGHMSNHIAMLIALGDCFPAAREKGLRGLEETPRVVMSGPIAHYSHRDSAFHFGVGWGNVDLVGAHPDFTSDPMAIDEALANCPDGSKVFMVVGVAGNCRTTGLDNLLEIGEVCRKHGVWFHVDACHGGNLIFSDKLRQELLAGIESADSVSIDPHKGLFTPYPSSYVLFREREKLCQLSRHEATVMKDGAWDLGLVMPFFGSRGFESLRTWMMMKELGVEKIGGLVERRNVIMKYFEASIQKASNFIALNDIDYYRQTLVFCPKNLVPCLRALSPESKEKAAKIISQYTSKLNTTLYEGGMVCFDEHTLADLANRVGLDAKRTFTILGACIGNPLIGKAEVDYAVGLLNNCAESLVEELVIDLNRLETAVEETTLAGPAGWS